MPHGYLPFYGLSQLTDVMGLDDLLNGPDFIPLIEVDIGENINLILRAGISHHNLEEKPIELGFREGIGAVLLHGVLRGHDDEGIC